MADSKRGTPNLKNPRNPDSPLFKRLTRLLSGPIVNRRVQMQRRYRRAQLDKFNFTSAGGLNFKRTSYNPYDNLSAQVMANQNRQERYLDFDQMEVMENEEVIDVLTAIKGIGLWTAEIYCIFSLRMSDSMKRKGNGVLSLQRFNGLSFNNLENDNKPDNK